MDKELGMHRAYAKASEQNCSVYTCGLTDHHRLGLSSGCLQSWGVRLTQMRNPTPTTQAYVDVLLDTALHQVGVCHAAPSLCNFSSCLGPAVWSMQVDAVVLSMQSLPCISAAISTRVMHDCRVCHLFLQPWFRAHACTLTLAVSSGQLL